MEHRKRKPLGSLDPNRVESRKTKKDLSKSSNSSIPELDDTEFAFLDHVWNRSEDNHQSIETKDDVGCSHKTPKTSNCSYTKNSDDGEGSTSSSHRDTSTNSVLLSRQPIEPNIVVTKNEQSLNKRRKKFWKKHLYEATKQLPTGTFQRLTSENEKEHGQETRDSSIAVDSMSSSTMSEAHKKETLDLADVAIGTSNDETQRISPKPSTRLDASASVGVIVKGHRYNQGNTNLQPQTNLETSKLSFSRFNSNDYVPDDKVAWNAMMTKSDDSKQNSFRFEADTTLVDKVIITYNSSNKFPSLNSESLDDESVLTCDTGLNELNRKATVRLTESYSPDELPKKLSAVSDDVLSENATASNLKARSQFSRSDTLRDKDSNSTSRELERYNLPRKEQKEATSIIPPVTKIVTQDLKKPSIPQSPNALDNKVLAPSNDPWLSQDMHESVHILARSVPEKSLVATTMDWRKSVSTKRLEKRLQCSHSKNEKFKATPKLDEPTEEKDIESKTRRRKIITSICDPFVDPKESNSKNIPSEIDFAAKAIAGLKTMPGKTSQDMQCKTEQEESPPSSPSESPPKTPSSTNEKDNNGEDTKRYEIMNFKDELFSDSIQVWTAEYAASGKGYEELGMNKAPIFRVGGRLFKHTPLPPGWSLCVSKSKSRPYYMHPNFGISWFAPVPLPSLDGRIKGTEHFIPSNDETLYETDFSDSDASTESLKSKHEDSRIDVFSPRTTPSLNALISKDPQFSELNFFHDKASFLSPEGQIVCSGTRINFSDSSKSYKSASRRSIEINLKTESVQQRRLSQSQDATYSEVENVNTNEISLLVHDNLGLEECPETMTIDKVSNIGLVTSGSKENLTSFELEDNTYDQTNPTHLRIVDDSRRESLQSPEQVNYEYDDSFVLSAVTPVRCKENHLKAEGQPAMYKLQKQITDIVTARCSPSMDRDCLRQTGSSYASEELYNPVSDERLTTNDFLPNGTQFCQILPPHRTKNKQRFSFPTGLVPHRIRIGYETIRALQPSMPLCSLQSTKRAKMKRRMRLKVHNV